MALKTFKAAVFAAKHFAAQALAGTQELLASLGAWGGYLKERKPKKKKEEIVEVVPEALPDPVISRIQDELISASLAADVIQRARTQAQRQRNHAAILLTL